MSQEPAVPIPSEEPRYCPACGTRVAEKATTCLMCGASLAEPVPPPAEEKPEPRRRHWFFWPGVVLLSLLMLAAIGLAMRPLIFPATIAPTPTRPVPPSPSPTITGLPTQTPTATATPTPLPPRAHQVQAGETLIAIAEIYDTTVDEILALNPGINPDLLQQGYVLLIPPAVPTPVATVGEETGEPTPTPGDFIIHVVAPGETLISIAAQYNTTVTVIRNANPEIAAGSDVIHVNQSLVIPLGTPMPRPTATIDPNATPTPIPPYPPPLLLNPPDGASFYGPEASIVLQWASVGILRFNEWYQVHLARAGAEPIVVRTRATWYRVPAEMYPPSGAVNHELRWHVQIVREVPGTDAYERVSEPEPVRIFFWLEGPPPTPGP
ncbi:MAG: LysM peptidoglycan-binding domain-containing protein [Anaerolineae bacterium]|nr:LysM peptidoglycan-binding domain-containing protein [Anaerolineae bacterium]